MLFINPWFFITGAELVLMGLVLGLIWFLTWRGGN